MLASSLDLATTMSQVAQLTVPRLADLCVIDLRDERRLDQRAGGRRGRRRLAPRPGSSARAHPLDPDGEHPVARVIRSGEPELLAEMTRGAAALVRAGLRARGLHDRPPLSLGGRRAPAARGPYARRAVRAAARGQRALRREDLELVCELARRAALAIDNARLFSEVRGSSSVWKPCSSTSPRRSPSIDEHGRTVFANQAAPTCSASDARGARRARRRADHGALHRARRARARARPRFDARQDACSGRAARAAAGEEHRARDRRGALVIVGVLRRSRPRDRARDVCGERVREHHRGQARAAGGELHGPGQPRARLLDGLRRDAAAVARLAARRSPTGARSTCSASVARSNGWPSITPTPRCSRSPNRLDRDYRPALEEPTGRARRDPQRAARASSTTSTPDALAAYARDDEHLQLLAAIGATAVIIVPLAAPARTLGAITLVSSQSGRRLSRADLALAVRLGRRAGTAVESARLYTERSRIAHVLAAGAAAGLAAGDAGLRDRGAAIARRASSTRSAATSTTCSRAATAGCS